MLCCVFQPLYSDGVTVTPDAPLSDGITSASLTDTNVTFTMSQFVDPSVSSVTVAGDVISRQEWTLQVHDSGHSPEQLHHWQLMSSEDIVCRVTKNSTRQVKESP